MLTVGALVLLHVPVLDLAIDERGDFQPATPIDCFHAELERRQVRRLEVDQTPLAQARGAPVRVTHERVKCQKSRGKVDLLLPLQEFEFCHAQLHAVQRESQQGPVRQVDEIFEFELLARHQVRSAIVQTGAVRSRIVLAVARHQATHAPCREHSIAQRAQGFPRAEVLVVEHTKAQ
jgi:hypothetical protein